MFIKTKVGKNNFGGRRAHNYKLSVQSRGTMLRIRIDRPKSFQPNATIEIDRTAARWLGVALLANTENFTQETDLHDPLSATFEGDKLTKHGWEEDKERAWQIRLSRKALIIVGPGSLTIRDENFNPTHLKKDTRTALSRQGETQHDVWHYELSNGQILSLDLCRHERTSTRRIKPYYILKYGTVYWKLEGIHLDRFFNFFEREWKKAQSSSASK